MTKFKSLLALSLVGMALAAPYAVAHERGDIIMRAGAVTVDPREESEAVKLHGTGKLPGSSVGVNSDTQIGLNYLYMLTDHVGIEYLAATPFKHDAYARGLPADLNGHLGTFKELPPTVSLVYFPLSPYSPVQPYVGAGINYTYIFETKLGDSAEKKGFKGLGMDNSVGWAVEAGVDYMLTDTIMLNAQVRYVDINTTATTHLNGQKVSGDVVGDPMVYMVSLGYKY